MSGKLLETGVVKEKGLVDGVMRYWTGCEEDRARQMRQQQQTSSGLLLPSSYYVTRPSLHRALNLA